MIDRIAKLMPLPRPLGRLRGLSAGQDRRAGRCGGRAAGGAGGARRRRAHAAAGLSGGAGRARAADAGATRSPDLFGGAGAACWRARAAGSTCSCSTRRTCLPGPATLCRPGRARLAGQPAALRRPGAVAAEIGRGACRGFVPDVVHCHDWQAGLAPAYLRYGGGARPRHGDDDPQPGLPGPVAGGLLARAGLAAGRLAIEGVEYLRRRSAS